MRVVGIAVVILLWFTVIASLLCYSSDGKTLPTPIEILPGTIDTIYQPADTIFVDSVRDSVKLQSLLDRTTRLERRVDELYMLLDGNADGLM